MQWDVTNQWLSYDLGRGGRSVGALCLRWDDFKNITYGATSVRVDTSVDGVTWAAGDTYTTADGMMEPTGYRPRHHVLNTDGYAVNTPLEDLCFNIGEVTTQHVRLFFAQATDPEDLWLGVAEVGFKCRNQPTPAPIPLPTASPTATFEPTPVPSADFCRPDKNMDAACLAEPDGNSSWWHRDFGCAATLDGTSAAVDEGWWPPEGATADQWLAYDLLRETVVGQVCVRWGEHHAASGRARRGLLIPAVSAQNCIRNRHATHVRRPER